MKRSRRLVQAVLVVALLGAALAFRAPLLRVAAELTIDAATGYRVSFGDFTVGNASQDRLGRRPGGWFFDGRDVRVDGADGATLLTADDVRVYVPPTPLFPWMRQAAIFAVRPELTIRRRPDGSFEPSVGGSGGSSGQGSAWYLGFEISQGRIAFEDPSRRLANARRFAAERIEGMGGFGFADGSSHYHLRGELVTTGERDPFTLAGRLDRSGYALHRLRAARLPVAAVADYFLDSPKAAASGGSMRDVELSAYRFDPSGSYHVAGGGMLDGVTLNIPGLAVPATGMHGRLDLNDAGIAARLATARIGAMPVRIAGGVIDWHAAELRLAVTSPTSFRAVKGIFRFSRRLPIAGPARVATLIEGAAGDPLVDARLEAPQMTYAALPFEDVRARIVYAESAVDVWPVTAHYGATAVRVEGTIGLGDVAEPRLFADATGPAASVPYAAQAAPGALLHASGYLEGRDVAVDAEGLLDGGGGGASLGGLFRIDRRGDGAFGPLLVRRDDGARLAGTLYLNREANESGFWVAASGFRAIDAGAVRLPGLPEFGPPRFSAGTLDGAVVGDGRPSTFRIAGSLAARDLEIGNVRIASASAGVTGNLTSLQLAGARAEGAWGSFAGRGTYAGGELAADGDYRGSFERLEPFTGALGARGPIDGPVAIVLGPTRTVVQARGDATAGAVVQGVPVGSLAGTLAVRGRRLDVLAADVAVPGAALAMAGDVGTGDALGVSVAGADARGLRGTGSPLDAGRVAAIGAFMPGDRRGPDFTGGIAVAAGRANGYAVAGDSDMRLARGSATLEGAAAIVDGAYGRIDGRIWGFGPERRPLSYDVGVRVRDVALAPLVRREFAACAPARPAFAPGAGPCGQAYGLAGNVDGDVRIAGTGRAPRLDGSLALRAASIDGQFVPVATASVGFDPAGSARLDGRLRVGSTAARFAFLEHGDDVAARLDAPEAVLSDFDDLFDEGDMLGGRGRVDLAFARSGSDLRTSADVDLAGLRIRSYDLGNAAAQWRGSGDRVNGRIGFGGASGRLDASGTVTLAARAPFDRLLQRSRFDGRATVRGLDLATWLPVLGYAEPLTGRLDADATLHGTLGAPRVTAHATLVDGSVGKFPVDRFQIDASSGGDRTTIEDAELDMLGVTVSAAGSFGLAPASPVALSLHAEGDDVGALSAKLFGAGRYDVHGRAESDVRVGGTRARPAIAGDVRLERASFGGVAIPEAAGRVALSGTDLVVSDASASFAKGSLRLAGALPLSLQPFEVGPSTARLALNVTADDVDLTDFASLLPAGSTLRGRVDGNVALGGTVAEPRLTGNADLTGGVLQTPVEREPLTAIGASVAFRDQGAVLERFHAETGGGSLDATGRLRLADLAHPTTDGDYRLDARAAALRLDLPEFGFGTVDGTLSLTHEPGALPVLAATATVQDGVIPFAALLLAAGSASGAPTNVVVPPAGPAARDGGDVKLALSLTAGRNVRVRSGNVDIGGRGAIEVSGTRSHPVLQGGFTSTGGTLTYFNTLFRVQSGTVTFEPDLGVIPYLDAVATTHVSDPDPNYTRNLSGFADVTLGIAGPVTNLTIGLQSDPPYDREQILGLLLNAPQLGATTLFDSTTAGIAPLGQLAAGQTTENLHTLGAYEAAQRPLTPAGDVFATTVGEEAFGVVNAQFTRNLLAPFENAFSDAIGLSAVNINVDYTGSVGLTARKILGKTVNAIYSTSFGYPYRQSVGFEVKPSENTAAQVTVFQTIGNEILGLGAPNTIILPNSTTRVGAAEPTNGTIGFSLSIQRFIK